MNQYHVSTGTDKQARNLQYFERFSMGFLLLTILLSFLGN